MMATDQQQKLMLRVIFSDGDIRKTTLTTRPSSVDDLISILKTTLGFNYPCCLQYEDREFDNQLCNLTNIADLSEKATVKVIPVLELEPVALQNELFSDTQSFGSADTEIIPRPQGRMVHWPEAFPIPSFSVDVNFRLRQADLLYLKDGKCLKLSRDVKHDILQRLAESMYQYTAYPNDAQYDSVAKALIAQHPSLQEPCSRSRCCGWKYSLKYKMANYRCKLRQSGRLDVMVNGGKRGGRSPGQPGNLNIKKPKKGELNYLPNFPDGCDDEGLERAREQLVDEMKKREPNAQLIKQKMEMTFALRRKEVVEGEPAISQMLERWPALFTEDQVCSMCTNSHFLFLFHSLIFHSSSLFTLILTHPVTLLQYCIYLSHTHTITHTALFKAPSYTSLSCT